MSLICKPVMLTLLNRPLHTVSQINFELKPGCDPVKVLEGTRAVLRRTQIMLKTLSGLRKSLFIQRDTIDCTLTRVAMRHGLDKLPDEILAIVLSLVDDDFEKVVGLSSVCKRFRAVMLATPRIWANCVVSSDLDPGYVKTIIGRSRTLPLRCEVSVYLLVKADAPCKIRS